MNRAMNRIDLDGGGYIETGLLEPQGHSAGAGKKIDTEGAHRLLPFRSWFIPTSDHGQDEPILRILQSARACFLGGRDPWFDTATRRERTSLRAEVFSDYAGLASSSPLLWVANIRGGTLVADRSGRYARAKNNRGQI